MKQKRTKISTKDRADIILKLGQGSFRITVGVSSGDLAIKYSCGIRTIQKIRSNKPQLDSKDVSESKFRIRKANAHELNVLVKKHIDYVRKSGIAVGGAYIKQRGMESIQKILSSNEYSEIVKSKYRDFKCSDSWLDKFKNENGGRKVRINGERASVNMLETEILMEPIRQLAENFEKRDIFNWDETGLFYRQQPMYTLAFGKEDSGAGNKAQKHRITVMPMVNYDGSEKNFIIIGKSKTPNNCSADFWEAEGIKYYSNSKAWMNSSIFRELLRDFDSTRERKTLLLLDNFKGHSKDLDLEEFKYLLIAFLPPNTTSETQPLDAGIIATFKLGYRKQLLSYIGSRLEKDRVLQERRKTVSGDSTQVVLTVAQPFNMNEINMHRIVPWIKKAIDLISPEMIENCFRKALKLDHQIIDLSNGFKEMSVIVQNLCGNETIK